MTVAPDESAARRAWLPRIWAFAAAYSFALLYANYQTGFHVGLNDFWGNYYQAENLDLSNPESLYDGFFPIGYPLILRSLPIDDLVAGGFMLAAAARLVFLGAFGSMLLALISGPWAMVATISIALVPRMFQHLLTPAADIPMLIFLTPGAALLAAGVLLEAPRRRRAGTMILAGILLGAAGLFRQHALAAALGFMFGCVVVRPRMVAWVFLAGVACTLAYSPQMILSVLAGHGPLETAQYVNVYKMVHGVELRGVPLDLAPGIVGIIEDDPAAFVRAWAERFAGMLPLLVPALIAAMWRGDVVMRRLGRIVLVAGFVYFAAAAMGWSHRAVLPIMPWTVAITAALLYRVYRLVAARNENSGRRLVAVGTACLVALGFVSSNQNGELVSIYLADHHRYSMVEQYVEIDGVVHPKQVYTTDGSLYLPLTSPHFPYFDGTWLMFGSYQYAERYPRLRYDSLDVFHQDCVREGITHLALTANAGEVSEVLGDLRSNPRVQIGFEYLGSVAGYELFKRR